LLKVDSCLHSAPPNVKPQTLESDTAPPGTPYLQAQPKKIGLPCTVKPL
jgi:hypothetical protein